MKNELTEACKRLKSEGMILASDILVMPKVGQEDIIYFFVILVLGGITYYLIKHLAYKQKLQSSSKGFSQSEALIRRLTPAESKVIKLFVSRLKPELREKLLLTGNWLLVKQELYHFLISSKKLQPEIAVRIFDKIYLKKPLPHEFTEKDIIIGEIAALILPGGEELVRIVRKTDQDILLSAVQSDLGTGVKKISTKLYLYRPHQGGFYLPGEIIGILNDAIIFHITGKIEHAGHAHLMLTNRFPAHISSWPEIPDSSPGTNEWEDHPLLEPDPEAEEVESEIEKLQEEIQKRFYKDSKKDPKVAKLPMENITRESNRAQENQRDLRLRKNIHFDCDATKLSDRGIVFELPEGMEPDFWKRSEFWMIRFHSPRGREMNIRGKILLSSERGSRFLFRFMDLDEGTRLQIYNEIKDRGGVREVLN
jgi:hypothetical protein